jgi:hypothetical protein
MDAGLLYRRACLLAGLAIVGWIASGEVSIERTTDQRAVAADTMRLQDDFENGLAAWTAYGANGAVVRASNDPAHGNVLVLRSNGDVHVLARGSERWGSVRLEGDMRFVSDTDSYLGVVYNYSRRGERQDFGLVYVKSPEGYLQANPHRDYAVSRTIYPEFQVKLGDAAPRRGEWQHFKVEVVGQTTHFYVGDMATPRMVFPLFEGATGAVGLQPRSVGSDVWVDNITITSIHALSYQPPVGTLASRYAPDSLLTDWEVAGPLPRTNDALARSPARSADGWHRAVVDARGAVITGATVDFHGPNTVAYYRARVRSPDDADATLHVSTADDLALWVNGGFAWFIARQSAAWFDFWKTPEHEGRRIPVRLRTGENDLVLRVRGGSYATGGFFARIERR